jgi:iron complex outermembrane recepter protein
MRPSKAPRYRFWGALIYGLLLAPVGAGAAERVIEEVIVTAQKRVQDVIDVPTAVTVFGGEDIKDASFSELGDISAQTANLLTVPNTQTGAPGFIIRGVTSASGGNSGFSPPLGVYVDEVFMGRDRAFNQILNDIERIEVLKGPQGTLFGRNTTGGAISVTTRKPTEDFDLSVDATYGVDNLWQFRGSVGGPVIDDKLFVRVSAVSKKQDGYLYNPFLDVDLNASDEWGGRIIAVANLTDRLRFEFSADYYELDNNPSMETVSSVLPVPFPVIPDDRIVPLDQDGIYTREMWGTSGRFDYELGNGMNLTSITGYRKFKTVSLIDSDGKPTFEFTTGRDEDAESFSQEIRLASDADERLYWLVGGYYFYEDVESVRSSIIGDAFPVAIFAPALGGLLAPIPEGQQERTLLAGSMETKSYAAFGHLEYAFTEKLTAAIGVRYTKEDKKGSFEQTWDTLVPSTLTLFDPPGVVIPLPGTVVPLLFTPTPFTVEKITEREWSGDLSVSYAFQPSMIGYAKYSRGFKAGGFNLDVISPPNSIDNQFGFDPETVNNYEIGLKSRFLDNRLSINIAAFFLDFEDKQEMIVNLSSFFVSNAGGAEIRGAEIEFEAEVLPRLSIFGNLGLLDSEYTKFPATTATADFTGNTLSFAPEVSGSINAQYVHPLPNMNAELFVRGGADYIDDFFTGPQNSLVTRQDSATLINARLGLRAADQRWEVYAWGRNLTDKDILGGGTNVITITTRTINRGREWGLEFRYNLF